MTAMGTGAPLVTVGVEVTLANTKTKTSPACLAGRGTESSVSVCCCLLSKLLSFRHWRGRGHLCKHLNPK